MTIAESQQHTELVAAARVEFALFWLAETKENSFLMKVGKWARIDIEGIAWRGFLRGKGLAI